MRKINGYDVAFVTGCTSIPPIIVLINARVHQVPPSLHELIVAAAFGLVIGLVLTLNNRSP